MKQHHTSRRAWTLLLLSLFTTTLLLAQPGGPGGRPGGPGGRPPMGGRDGGPGRQPRQGDDRSTQTIRQQKKVKEGDTFRVVGTLRDSTTNENLPYVNVALLSTKDSSLVRGTATDGDGRFELKNIEAGNYLLFISCIGYENHYRPVSVTNNTALGTLRMKQGAQMMKEVSIVADRPLFSMDGEKLVYSVADDPSVQSGTTSDALQNAPGVEVDIEGNVTLRGVSSVEIWINDRPSKLTQENLKTYLETLPANALDRIETITNPSAKYATDADAVINIVTSAHIKKNHFISFGVNGSSQPSVSPWLSYMWANERLSVNIFASARFNRSESRSESNAIYSPFNADSNAYLVSEVDSTRRESDGRNFGGNLFANFDYYIDSARNLSGWGSLNLGRNLSVYSADILRDQSFVGQPRYEYLDSDSTIDNSRFGMLGVNYLRKFDDNGHNLRLSMHGNYSSNASDGYYSRVYSSTFSLLDEYKYNYNQTSQSSLGFDARYNRPLSEQTELSLGVSTGRDDSRGTIEKDFGDGSSNVYDELDSLRSYTTFSNIQQLGGDVNLTHRVGSFTVELGLGYSAEHLHFNYTSTLLMDDDTALWQHTVRPSIHLSYYTRSMHNFKLNYSLRMREPRAGQLTTFRTYGQDSYSTGNRNLKSSLTNNAEAGWTKYFDRFGSVGVEAYARWSTNEISSLNDVANEVDEYLNRMISYSMPYNMGSSYRYGTTLHTTYRPSGFFNVRLYANLYDYGYHMDRGTQGELTDNKVSWSFRLNAWAKVKENYQIYASANYSSPTISLASQRKATYNMNFGVRADFFKRKLSAYVHVQDIFNWGYRFGSGNINTNPSLYSNSTNYSRSSRFISAGLTFRFGKMELEKQAREGNSTETGDESSE